MGVSPQLRGIPPNRLFKALQFIVFHHFLSGRWESQQPWRVPCPCPPRCQEGLGGVRPRRTRSWIMVDLWEKWNFGMDDVEICGFFALRMKQWTCNIWTLWIIVRWCSHEENVPTGWASSLAVYSCFTHVSFWRIQALPQKLGQSHFVKTGDQADWPPLQLLQTLFYSLTSGFGSKILWNFGDFWVSTNL